MDLDRMHRTKERDTKDIIRKQWHSHRTNIDKYVFPDSEEYQQIVNELGVNILTYLVKQDKDKAREWVSTSTMDFKMEDK